jgi:hypothetical protein
MAAPRILIKTFGDLRSQGVVMDVFYKGQQVSVAVAKDGFVPALKEVPHSLVPSIIVHGIALVDTLKDFGERNVPGFNQKVDMVGHKYVGIEMKMIALFVADKDLDKFAIIEGIFKYRLLLVSPGDYMIKGAFVFNSGVF